MAPAEEDQGNSNALPEAIVLEKWMMGTAKDADRSASFLRRLLRMNPAYAQYLSKDEELSGIVQLFSKRFRHIIQGAENPIQPSSLYKPICELAWRVVALVLSSVSELKDKQHQSGCSVPFEAHGQVKMLLESNAELSNKLNESRRAYLKELSGHRDKQRKLSEKTLNVISSLTESPIMFYEPLEFILDETTKEFVRDVVEERVKLEMRAGFSQDEAHEEVKLHMEELEAKLKKATAELRDMTAEMRKAKRAEMTAEDKATRAEHAAKSAEEETERWKNLLAEKDKELEEMRDRIMPLELQLTQKSRRIAALETQGEQSRSDSEVTRQRQASVTETTNSQLNESLEQIKALQQKLAAAENENKAMVAELTTSKSNVENLGKRLSAVQEGKPDVAPITIIEEKIVEKIVYVEKDATDHKQQQQLEKVILVEQELRAANEALQKQLEEERARVRQITATNTEVVKKERKDSIKQKPAPKVKEVKVIEKEVEIEKVIDQEHVDAEVEKAVNDLSKAHNKKVKELEEIIAKLRAELEAANQVPQEPNEVSFEEVPLKVKKKKKKEPETIEVGPDEEKIKLKQNYDSLMDQHDDLQDEYAKLEQKVSMLVEKLKEAAGSEVVADTLARIKLTPPPPKKKKKKKAYERLYDDAQRRLVDMRVKAERAERAQERALVDAAAKVSDRKSYMAVKTLCQMQKTAATTSADFSKAVETFQQEYGEGEPSGGVGLHQAGLHPLPTISVQGNATMPEDAATSWGLESSSSDDFASQMVENQHGRGRFEVRPGFQSLDGLPDVESALSTVYKQFESPKGASATRGMPLGVEASPEDQRRDAAAMHQTADNLIATPMNSTARRRGSGASGVAGFPFRSSTHDSLGSTPQTQKKGSLSSSNLQPVMTRGSSSEVNVSFQQPRSDIRFLNHSFTHVQPGASSQPGGHPSPSHSSSQPGNREGVGVSGASSSELQPMVLFARQPDSSNLSADPSTPSVTGYSSSSRRFVRFGAEAVLGTQMSNSRTNANAQSLSPGLMQRSVRVAQESVGPHERSLRPNEAHSSSSGPFRRHSPRAAMGMTVADQVTSTGWNLMSSTSTRHLPLAGAKMGVRSTPDLIVTSTQFQKEKLQSWDPLDQGRRHRGKAGGATFQYVAAPMTGPPT